MELEDKLQELLMENLKTAFRSNTVVKDLKGNGLELLHWNGQLLPPFPIEKFQKLSKIPIRDDDVMICGYPKTGCHWTWEVASMIIDQSTSPSKFGKGACFMEFVNNDILEARPSLRVLNTHVIYNQIPEQAREKQTKIVLTVRNPKDTAVSYYNHHKNLDNCYKYSGEFHDWFNLYMNGQVDYGSYFEYYKQWSEDIYDNPNHPILVLAYEDMKEDLPRSIRRLAKFFNIQLTDEVVMAITEAAGFNKMKQALENNPSSKLMRKGTVGDWKNWLTVSESEQIDVEMLTHLPHTVFSTPKYTL